MKDFDAAMREREKETDGRQQLFIIIKFGKNANLYQINSGGYLMLQGPFKTQTQSLLIETEHTVYLQY